jgi:hypothetical protein
MKFPSTIFGFAAAVAAHGDHGHQEPLAGPLEGVWYNTLPGDGGKQVRLQCQYFCAYTMIDHSLGGFCFLWHLHVRSSALQPLLVHPHKLRHCIHWYDTVSLGKSHELMGLQVLPLTLVLRTVRELVSGPTESDKVLAVSISSMSPQAIACLLLAQRLTQDSI